MKRIVTIILLMIAVVWNGWSQSAADELAERIIPSGDDDLNYEDLFESLSQFTTNPINLNTASSELLLSLGLLSRGQAEAIIKYRNESGELLELYELQSVPGLDLELIRTLLPFVTVRPTQSGKKFVKRVVSQQSSYFLTRYERTLQKSRGFTSAADSSSRYQGDPGRIYSRLRITSPGDVSIGLTGEKDAGEEWNNGFDFYSGHFQLINKGPLVNVVAGDFTAQFGQGVTLGGGFGAGKGSETINTLRRTTVGFIPYSSANELGFFRGAAATIRLRDNMRAHAFASWLPRDASGADETSLAVLQSGKHRTPNEIRARHQLLEQNFGSLIEFKSSAVEAGCVYHQTIFNQPINKSSTLYNSFDFRGSANTNVGFFGSINLHNFSFFGEVSQTLNNGRGWIGGMLATITRSIDVSLLARHFDRNFHSFYSNALSENTMPKNESGLYWGWKHAVNRRLSYTAYVDLFRFPWLKFRVYQPSEGSETMIRLTYKPSKVTEFYVQFRDERKQRNFSEERTVYAAGPVARQNLILNSSLTIGKLSLKTRIQCSAFRTSAGRTDGFAIALDAGYDWNKVSVATRFALFDTDDFDNRQYMNERDVLMAFSFPAYYGEGTRSCLVVRWQPVKWLDLGVKAAGTSYFHATSSGSGGDMIAGNKRHDVKLQVVFRLN